MTFELAAFYAFALVTTVAAGMVITLKNPVHAVLSLILTFFSTACLWLLLQAEFLGVVLVLVYIGAVMILFLFVVMMLDLNMTPIREGFARYFPVAMLVAAVMLFQMIGLIGVRGASAMAATDPAAASGNNVNWLAEALFTRFMLPFEIAAVILTVAIVVAVMLTLRRREGTKHQDPSRQVAVRREDRIRLVKMKPDARGEGQ